jgi:hypothetical protein
MSCGMSSRVADPQIAMTVMLTEVSDAHWVYWIGQYGRADGPECDEGRPYDGG